MFIEVLKDIFSGGGHPAEIATRKLPDDIRDLMGTIGVCDRCAEITEADARYWRLQLSREIQQLEKEIDLFSPRVDDGGPYYGNRGLFFHRTIQEILKQGRKERAERRP
ncbi:hypothetical protein [Rhizobium sp. H4]|uniref:hypothetical protein n=1 Tax=Rhizobium sp. H4 TaxID=2035449 RepID=UPI000D0EA0C6|nr:hypothetical protein [Rhizobium sp. H4]